MLVEVTLFLNHLECLTNAGSCRDKEHVTVLAFALIFLNDTPRDVKQGNDTIRISLLAGDVNPLASVFVRLDVTFFEIGEVSPTNAGKAAEYKKVSCMAETVGVQFKCHHLMKVLHRQVVVVGFHFVVFESCKRVSADNLFLDSLTYYQMQLSDAALQ